MANYILFKLETLGDFAKLGSIELPFEVYDVHPRMLGNEENNTLHLARDRQKAIDHQLFKYANIGNTNTLAFSVYETEVYINRVDATKFKGKYYLVKIETKGLLYKACKDLLSELYPSDKMVDGYCTFDGKDTRYSYKFFKTKKEATDFMATLPQYMSKAEVIRRNGDEVIINC